MASLDPLSHLVRMVPILLPHLLCCWLSTSSSQANAAMVKNPEGIYVVRISILFAVTDAIAVVLRLLARRKEYIDCIDLECHSSSSGPYEPRIVE